jgi:hypothetical protein
MRNGSDASLFGISIWGEERRDAWWFKAVFFVYMRLRGIDDAWNWIRYRTWDRYHVVVTDMRPGYSDVDEIMFRACFALLRKYVEIELGREAWFGPDAMYRGYRLHSTGDSDKKAIDLWIWYSRVLPVLEAEENADYTGFQGKYGHPNEYDVLENIKEEKLAELIRMRRTLWT